MEVYDFVALMSDDKWHHIGQDTSQYSAENQAEVMAKNMGLTVKKVITNDELLKIERKDRIEELESMLPDAINTIKELCNMFEDGCSGCPLDKNNNCVVECPCLWQESEDKEDG